VTLSVLKLRLNHARGMTFKLETILQLGLTNEYLIAHKQASGRSEIKCALPFGCREHPSRMLQ
jgi:hypothetical protein